MELFCAWATSRAQALGTELNTSQLSSANVPLFQLAILPDNWTPLLKKHWFWCHCEDSKWWDGGILYSTFTLHPILLQRQGWFHSELSSFKVSIPGRNTGSVVVNSGTFVPQPKNKQRGKLPVPPKAKHTACTGNRWILSICINRVTVWSNYSHHFSNHGVLVWEERNNNSLSCWEQRTNSEKSGSAPKCCALASLC